MSKERASAADMWDRHRTRRGPVLSSPIGALSKPLGADVGAFLKGPRRRDWNGHKTALLWPLLITTKSLVRARVEVIPQPRPAITPEMVSVVVQFLSDWDHEGQGESAENPHDIVAAHLIRPLLDAGSLALGQVGRM
jgi:hypothetical protein